MFEKKHKPEHIVSAHDKLKRKNLGEGGIVFEPEEQAVIDGGVPLSEAEKKDAVER